MQNVSVSALSSDECHRVAAEMALCAALPRAKLAHSDLLEAPRASGAVETRHTRNLSCMHALAEA